MNVVLIVMESVGARRVGLYGAPVDDSPQMIRLSRHAALFEDVHVSEPCTSCAMAALFSSVYPDHDWPTITRLAPALAIPGLPAVLARHGYRTAFIHSGQLAYEKQQIFLRTRGFEQVVAEQRDYDAPRDRVLLPETMEWIKADPSRPFFVALWTQDTHHPYETALHRDLGSNASRLNDYLNAVDATDTLIGQLADALQKAGLADQTLLVITGDHGEAFGEHGVLAHGGNVYDEETKVPLLIVNPKLFPHERVVNGVAQQIDIAPTLLGLLGYSAPPLWQGVDLFEPNGARRAYLFSGQGTASFGLIEGDFKYIYRVNENSEELYDLTRDPYERNNLSGDPAYSAMMRRDHLRLEAWVSFQNPYLTGSKTPVAYDLPGLKGPRARLALSSRVDAIAVAKAKQRRN
ncbi:MAG TPA: sulfatase [Candidatus Binatus sp.]|nr:sulfatase [Candidatus Binatus sp.]